MFEIYKAESTQQTKFIIPVRAYINNIAFNVKIKIVYEKAKTLYFKRTRIESKPNKKLNYFLFR